MGVPQAQGEAGKPGPLRREVGPRVAVLRRFCRDLVCICQTVGAGTLWTPSSVRSADAVVSDLPFRRVSVGSAHVCVTVIPLCYLCACEGAGQGGEEAVMTAVHPSGHRPVGGREVTRSG